MCRRPHCTQSADLCALFHPQDLSAQLTVAVEAQIAAQGKKVRAMIEAIKADANALVQARNDYIVQASDHYNKDELTAEVDKLNTLNMQKMQDASHKRPANLVPQTVFVAGLLKTAQVADVHSMMEGFGKIEEIRFIEGKGSALVTFADTMSGVQAINILNLIVQIPGADQPLTVQWSRHAFDRRWREREGKERHRERPHYAFDRRSTVVSGVAQLREAGRLMKGQHYLPGEISGNDSMEEGEILDSMEEGQISPPPHPSLKEFPYRGAKEYSAAAHIVKREYCPYCFNVFGKKCSHAVEMCFKKISADYRAEFRGCNTLQSVSDIVGKATEKDFILLHWVIAPAFCRTASIASLPQDKNEVIDIIGKLLAIVKNGIEQHQYNKMHGIEQNLSRKFSSIWWSLGTLSSSDSNLFQQWNDHFDLLETETIQAGFWKPRDPNESSCKFEPRSLIMFLRAKVHLGRHFFISRNHEQAVKDIISEKLELFTTQDLCQAVWGLIFFHIFYSHSPLMHHFLTFYLAVHLQDVLEFQHSHGYNTKNNPVQSCCKA
jgi:hypothetical protein